MIEFIVIPKMGNTTFLIMTVASLMDVVMGFTVTISTAKRDIAFEEPVEQEAERTFVSRPSAGSAPEVPKDTNPEVSKLYEELEQDKDKGVLAAKSSLFEPEKFDAKAYEADPQNWLSQIRPGRVFQPAQPGDDVAPIKTKSKVFNSILQGEKVVLEAKVEPNAPVSFYVPGVGVLDNQLTTQTIAADENGIARTTFTATKGTKGLVDIVAASPLHSGQLRYRVHVSLPNN